MANEFVIKHGLTVSGSTLIYGDVTGSVFSGSFVGDGTGLTGNTGPTGPTGSQGTIGSQGINWHSRNNRYTRN